MLANNVANSGTSAFKADREFYSVYAAEEAQQSGTDVTASPVIEKRWTDFSQGVLVPTGNEMDLAISGGGFFAVDSAAGPLYTRNGNFHVGKDGQIDSADGSHLRVKTPDNQPLKLDPARPVDISTDGTVRQDGRSLGQVELFDVGPSSAIAKRGNAYFQWLDSNGPQLVRTPELHQATLESSNVPVAESAVRLVSVMRQFEMLQRAVGMAGEMNRKFDEVARVSS